MPLRECIPGDFHKRLHVRLRNVALVALLLASPGFGHHSDAGLDMDSTVVLEGTVLEYNFRNPHVYIIVAVADDTGDTVEWELQTSSTITVMRMGWTRDSLAAGDDVTFSVHAAFDGRPYGLLNTIQKADGEILATSFYDTSGEPRIESPVALQSASSLEGKWIADGDKLVDYPGGFDGFFRAQLTLNDKALAAQAAYNELSSENPNATCVGRPTPALIVNTLLYPLEIEYLDDGDIVAIRSEFFDEERFVYMDGRDHPSGSDRFDLGHSIGRWEGDVLVVDTRNFADHRSPYQTGVPSGGEKHVVERFELSDDGTRIFVEFMLEDPEYLVGSMTHRRELIYVPDHEMVEFDCDIEATSRFVTE